jgi:hypothetical protein
MKNLDLVFKNLNFIRFLTAVAAGTLIGGPLGDRFEEIHHLDFNFGSPLLCFCLTLICFDWNIISGYRNCFGIFGHFSICSRIDAG